MKSFRKHLAALTLDLNMIFVKKILKVLAKWDACRKSAEMFLVKWTAINKVGVLVINWDTLRIKLEL